MLFRLIDSDFREKIAGHEMADDVGESAVVGSYRVEDLVPVDVRELDREIVAIESECRFR